MAIDVTPESLSLFAGPPYTPETSRTTSVGQWAMPEGEVAPALFRAGFSG